MPTKNDELLAEIRERFKEATDLWQDIRDEGKKDILCVAGHIWDAMDPNGKAQRETHKRPLLSLDELNQYTNQLVNHALTHPRAIKVAPAGLGANDRTAAVRADKIREIEYRSNAHVVYATMFQNTVERSYGFTRLKTKWQPGTWQQELWFEEVVNPNLITPDPWILRQTCEDMRYCFEHELRDRADFQKGGEFAGAKIVDFDGYQDTAPGWIFKNGTKIQVANYWKIELTKRTLLALPHPTDPSLPAVGVWKDTIPPNQWETVKSSVRREREEDYPQAKAYLTNGVEILKETDWKGRYIPIIGCQGKVLYVDDGSGARRRVMSLIRLARDPAMLYCYYRTQQAEIAGMIPKVPVMGAKGQFAGSEYDWQKAPHEPIAFIEYNAVTEATGDTILPAPIRLPYEPGGHLQSLELCAEGARRAIQSAMGAYALPTTAQRHNEKSGVALREIQENTQVGNFHFMDHYDDSIRHGGVVADDALRFAHDTSGPIVVRTLDGKTETRMVNNPNVPESVNLSDGTHDITISAGPSLDSEREEANALIDSLLGNPTILQIMGPQRSLQLLAKAIELRNPGPVGELLSQIILPGEGQPDVNTLMQQLGMTQAQLQEVSAAAMEMKQKLDAKVVESQAKFATAAMQEKAESDRAAADRETKLAVAELTAKVDRLALFLEERARLGVEEHERRTAAAEAGHEQHMAELAHAQGMQSAAQQAALQPPPEATA